MAISNPSENAKLAAVLVIRNDIISVGTNTHKTHPLQKKFSKNSDSIFLHAEINCIVNALKNIDESELKKATLYVYRVKKTRRFGQEWVDGLAAPCSGCMGAIKHFGIKRVIYSTDENGEFHEWV